MTGKGPGVIVRFPRSVLGILNATTRYQLNCQLAMGAMGAMGAHHGCHVACSRPESSWGQEISMGWKVVRYMYYSSRMRWHESSDSDFGARLSFLGTTRWTRLLRVLCGGRTLVLLLKGTLEQKEFKWLAEVAELTLFRPFWAAL